MDNQPQSSSSAEAQNPPEQFSQRSSIKRSWKKLAIIYLIVVILLYGGVYLFSSVQKSSISPTPAPTINPVPSLTPTSDETAGWKIYTDPKGMFLFKYPASINKGEVKIFAETLFADTVAEVRVDHPYSSIYPDGGSDAFTLSIGVWKNKRNVTTEQVKAEILSYKPPPGPYSVTYEDIKDYQSGVIKGVYYIAIGHQSHQEIQMATKNFVYTFYFNSESAETSGTTKRVIDKILSTFTFVQSYTCLERNTLNCMPPLNFDSQQQTCNNKDYLRWAKTNCPDFNIVY
ncbi:hypothetical protein A3C26_00220 [Candidatus Daviesbacteria bacterium RIFCSPHIGHO2_02_FULL_39_12]|uniref:Uncharacterized protein n=1 Tax=Candidatus Daviesbacteria bacterium RIFCSPHIGHO2_02_FULL_39_12 TaxID=1797770 RepID=A0A1F5J882_9BACT|nr:MAG: hypothetical protein A3C26_00220 [Candidatus Daviesbacteria bacterium RIFCSPHIGHO2_02_FULL_39_12]